MTSIERITHALTAYDQRQSGRRDYNPHALALYFEALTRAENEAAESKAGKWSDRFKAALANNFHDRVRTIVLHAMKG